MLTVLPKSSTVSIWTTWAEDRIKTQNGRELPDIINFKEKKEMDIMEMTRELGKALQQDDRYTAYMLAKQANDNDQELQEDIAHFAAPEAFWINSAGRKTGRTG